jgi:hypothetical protein
MTSNYLSKEVYEQWCRPGVGATRSCGPAATATAALVAPTPGLERIERGRMQMANPVPIRTESGLEPGPDSGREEYPIRSRLRFLWT